MKSYNQFRQELTRKRVMENVTQPQQMMGQPPQYQAPQQRVTQVQPGRGAPQQPTRPNDGGPSAQRQGQPFFQGMNFAPGLRQKMLSRVNHGQQGQQPIPDQSPMPQV